MNPCRAGGGFGEHAERPESVKVFRPLLCPAQTWSPVRLSVFPARRGRMGQQLVGEVFGLTRDGDGAFQIPGGPDTGCSSQ